MTSRASSLNVIMSRRPGGAPTADDFSLRDDPLPTLERGQVLVEASYLSVDPYQLISMSTLRPGSVVPGHVVGRVVESRHRHYEVGERVVHRRGWRRRAVSDDRGLLKTGSWKGPDTLALGVLGMPGFTAWIGLSRFGVPRPGEVVYVSAAAGAVGSVVGQLARRAGAHVIGSAGDASELRWLESIGFDVTFSRHTGSLSRALAAAAPNGIDVTFDLAGGAHLAAALEAARDRARVVVCGSISSLTRSPVEATPRLDLMFLKALTLHGFRYSDHLDEFTAFEAAMGPLVADGSIVHREHVVPGLESAGAALAMISDRTVRGKLSVAVNP